MKKALSIILVLAIMLMPMSVFAAVGDPVAVPSSENWIWSGDTVTVEAGATVYFEVGTEGVTGSYGFIVEGTGAFDVAVCGEDGAGAYVEGTPVAAVDGKVETTITSYDSTYGYACFSITNNTDAAVSYICTVVFPEGTQGNPKAVTLEIGTPVEVTVPAGGQYYVAATLPAMMVEYQLTVTGATGFGFSTGWMPTWDTNGVYAGTVSAYYGPASFSLVNNTASEQTYTLTLDNMPLGAESNPDSLPIDTVMTLNLEGIAYWYTWTAPSNGTFEFIVEDTLCADGWTYYLKHGDNAYNFSTGWGENDKNTQTLTVAEGDVIKFGVSVPSYNADEDYYNVYEPGKGTVVFTTTFTAEGGETPLYAYSNTNITADGIYALSTLNDYTILVFEPDATGKYTISSTDSLLGIVSYNGMWVTVEPSADTVNASSVEWECTGVGQSIWIAVASESNSADITVAFQEVVKVEVEWTVYENKVVPETFVYDGIFDEMLYVDTFDDILDSAVLGEDGYYHLNTADGPILYANLNDALTSLYQATGYGQLTEYVYENGELVAKINYNDALLEYFACASVSYDEDGNMLEALYPLTEDLVTIFKNAGNFRGWYGENGFIGGELEDAWMFACYYEEEVLPEYLLGDVNGDEKLSNVDYLMLKRIVMGELDTADLEDPETAELRCDLTGDGEFKAADYFMLKRIILFG